MERGCLGVQAARCQQGGHWRCPCRRWRVVLGAGGPGVHKDPLSSTEELLIPRSPPGLALGEESGTPALNTQRWLPWGELRALGLRVSPGWGRWPQSEPQLMGPPQPPGTGWSPGWGVMQGTGGATTVPRGDGRPAPSCCGSQGGHRDRLGWRVWWDLVRPSGTRWHLVGHNGTWWDPVRPNRTWWHPMGSGGTRWALAALHRDRLARHNTTAPLPSRRRSPFPSAERLCFAFVMERAPLPKSRS